MKLEKTVDGLFAAPVNAPTTAAAPRMRALAADIMANTPELAQFLDFGPDAASAVATTPASPQQQWAYGINYTLNTATTGSSAR